MSEMHYLYVMSAVENDIPVKPCKIGIARSTVSRLSSIQTGNPKKLQVIAAIPIPSRDIVSALEKVLHWTFEDYRLVGEWFDVSPIDAAIGCCTIAHEAFLQIASSETEALDCLDKLGITETIKRCFQYIDHCQINNIDIGSRIGADRGQNTHH